MIRVYTTNYVPWDMIPTYYPGAHQISGHMISSWCAFTRYSKPFHTILTFEPEFFDRNKRPNHRGVRQAISELTGLGTDRRHFSKRLHLIFAESDDALGYTSLYPQTVTMDHHRMLEESDIEDFCTYVTYCCDSLSVREQRDPSYKNRFKQWLARK